MTTESTATEKRPEENQAQQEAPTPTTQAKKPKVKSKSKLNLKPKPPKEGSGRLSNKQLSERLQGLISAAEKERNLRTVRENVINRENSFQLDGIIQKLKAMKLQFDLFTNPPKAS